MAQVLRAAGAVVSALGILLAPRAAAAHAIGLSRGEYDARGSEVRAETVLRLEDAMAAFPGLDADGDGRLSASEVDLARSSHSTTLVEAVDVLADGAPCGGTLEQAELEAPDGVRWQVRYRCPHPPGRLHFRFDFLERVRPDHRHLATVHLAGGDVDYLALPARPEVDVDVSAAAAPGWRSLLRGGVEHILTGADHLAFLLALVVGGTPARPIRTRSRRHSRPLRDRIGPLVTTLTAFTVGHSLSLALATLGGFAPGARVVEPAVALSVAYVGAENLLARSLRHRWSVTLPFGFVHGFAFAGGLLPLGLPRAKLPGALLSFNLGVELGQLLVLSLLFVPMSIAASRLWYPTLARTLSAAVVVVGLAWFVQRIA